MVGPVWIAATWNVLVSARAVAPAIQVPGSAHVVLDGRAMIVDERPQQTAMRQEPSGLASGRTFLCSVRRELRQLVRIGLKA